MDQHLSLLKDEYLKLQDQYEAFDARALTIKGWIGAGTIAGFGVALSQESFSGGLIWIFIIIVAFCFWYIEGYWKRFQYALGGRIKEIEKYFREFDYGGDEKIAPMQIYSNFFVHYKGGPEWVNWIPDINSLKLKNILPELDDQKFVRQPYVIIIQLSILGFCYDWVSFIISISPGE